MTVLHDGNVKAVQRIEHLKVVPKGLIPFETPRGDGKGSDAGA